MALDTDRKDAVRRVEDRRVRRIADSDHPSDAGAGRVPREGAVVELVVCDRREGQPTVEAEIDVHRPDARRAPEEGGRLPFPDLLAAREGEQLDEASGRARRLRRVALEPEIHSAAILMRESTGEPNRVIFGDDIRQIAGVDGW